MQNQSNILNFPSDFNDFGAHTSPPDCSTAPMILCMLPMASVGPAMRDVPVSAMLAHFVHIVVPPTDRLTEISNYAHDNHVIIMMS